VKPQINKSQPEAFEKMVDTVPVLTSLTFDHRENALSRGSKWGLDAEIEPNTDSLQKSNVTGNINPNPVRMSTSFFVYQVIFMIAPSEHHQQRLNISNSADRAYFRGNP